MCTTTMAFVRGVMRARMESGSRHRVAGSMSAKTGMAPLTSAQVAEAAIVYGRDDDLVAGAAAGRLDRGVERATWPSSR